MINLAEYRRKFSHLADFLPWAALVGAGVILNKDGSFQRTASSANMTMASVSANAAPCSSGPGSSCPMAIPLFWNGNLERISQAMQVSRTVSITIGAVY